jgi:hypothetical protein
MSVDWTPINNANSLFSFLKFCKDDDDYVLFRRFKDLHLLNIYSTNAELVELSQSMSALSHGVSEQNLPDYQRLIEKLGPTLEKFGK